jgi:phosphogluconate dehydratase
MARRPASQLTWQDISELSEAVPLLARVYPNGLADVNHFHAAGGMGFLISQLLKHGLLHEDVRTVFGQGLRPMRSRRSSARTAVWCAKHRRKSGDPKVLAPSNKAFQPTGGLKMLTGNLGKAVIKISAVKPERHVIEAPAKIFHSQQELQTPSRTAS